MMTDHVKDFAQRLANATERTVVRVGVKAMPPTELPELTSEGLMANYLFFRQYLGELEIIEPEEKDSGNTL